MRLTQVTITGADESVRTYDLCALYDEFPFVEWGILMSASREGKEPRYPSRQWIDNLLDRALIPLSAHLCGQFSRDAIDGPFLWAVERPEHFRRFRRIQFNGAEFTEPTLARTRRFGTHFPSKGFVIQVREFPPDVYRQLPHLLLDNSGGRGVALDIIPAPTKGAYCGYSGGLGPNNLEDVLTKLTALPGDAPFWVDMESGVRSDAELFDLAKVRQCLAIAAKFVK